MVIVNRWNGCGSGNEYLDGGRRVLSKGGLGKTSTQALSNLFFKMLTEEAESLLGYLVTLLQHLVTSAGLSVG